RKRLEPVRGTTTGGVPFSGYEIHMGLTTGADCARPFAHFDNNSAEGAVSADGRVCGRYIHGLFAHDRPRAASLAPLSAGPIGVAYDDMIEQTLDRLAAHIAAHVDLDRLLSLAR